MNDQAYIRKAVELADGWEMHSDQTFGISGTSFLNTSQVGLDALAAQLVRQVDATGEYYVIERMIATEISDDPLVESMRVRREHEGRTMNTIKAIVDSRVLT